MSARLAIQDNGEVILIQAFGKLASGEGRHSLHTQLRKLTRGGHLRVLLNVSGVPSMDTADIGELMAGYAAVATAGGELKLLDPRGRVEGMMRSTHIDKLMDTYVDEASALRSFSGMRQPRFRMAARCEPRSEWYYG